ncbi:unnamed protein product [Pieris brassicae]|uniref:Uncharacterized protein n=1 Tax=Pieris brassicae TaxID=7116 RepID=A0A9P0T4J4_PIEBR|nr:unnamed protein product [Pieris brassicae]
MCKNKNDITKLSASWLIFFYTWLSRRTCALMEQTHPQDRKCVNNMTRTTFAHELSEARPLRGAAAVARARNGITQGPRASDPVYANS